MTSQSLSLELLLKAKRELQSSIVERIFICYRCRIVVTAVNKECPGCGVNLRWDEVVA